MKHKKNIIFFSFLIICIFVGCNKNDDFTRETNIQRVIPPYPMGKYPNFNRQNLREKCYLVNSKSDLHNLNIDQNYIFFLEKEDIDFDSQSLIIKASYIDYIPINRSYDFVKEKEKSYIFKVDYIVKDTPPVEMILEYLNVLVPKINSNSTIKYHTSFTYRK